MPRLLHHLAREAAERDPDRDCLVERGRTLSYIQVWNEARRIAGLLTDMGLRPGERVALYLDKSAEEAIALLAVSLAGGIFVDINPQLRERQLEHILDDSGASVVITTWTRLQRHGGLIAARKSVRGLLACGPQAAEAAGHLAGIPVFSWRDEAAATVFAEGRGEGDAAGIIYTSGSTGRPKGVVVSHGNLLAGARSVCAYLRNTPDDRILSVLPFSFDYGLSQWTTALWAGATLVLLNYLSAADVVRALERERITGLAAIPTLWEQLVRLEWRAEQFPRLRYLTNSGGHFTEWMVHEYRRRLPDVDLYLMYGFTEAFRSTYLEPEQVDKRPGSIGKAIPDAQVLVVDAGGRVCGPGGSGELVHVGPHVAQGYWNDPEGSKRCFRPSPLDAARPAAWSGDLVRLDEDGYLYFVGRRDEMIKVSGFRVSPTEVEDYFMDSGRVADAVAVGVPDERLGARILVVVSAAGGQAVDGEELLAGVRSRMPSYMVPARVEVWPELPRSPNGKVDRARVRETVLRSAGPSE
jgi:acyl-CoA ligase (AMP-forming) (exosortase A-associated)